MMNTLLSEFDNIINDFSNELSSLSTDKTRHPETSTTTDDGVSPLEHTHTTTIVIDVRSPPQLEVSPSSPTPSPPPKTTANMTSTRDGMTDRDATSDVCSPPRERLNVHPPATLRKISKNLSSSSSLSSLDEDVVAENKSIHESTESLAFTEADLALENMLDDLRQLSAESFYDVSDTESVRSGSGSFTRLKSDPPAPPSLSDEQRIRFSIANFVDGTDADLDSLLDDLGASEGDMSRLSRQRFEALLDDLCTKELPRSPGEEGGVDANETGVNGVKGAEVEQKEKMFTGIPAVVIEPTEGIEQMQPVDPTHIILENLEPDQPGPETSETTKLNSEVLEAEKLISDILKSGQLDPEEEEGRKKAAKIRVALDKMKEANLMKVFVKVFNDECGTMKTIVVDQTWTARDLKQKMIVKDGVKSGPDWCIVEKLPTLFMERVLEDSEFVSQTVFDWSRDTDNFFVFLKRKKRYALFREPHTYLMADHNYPTTAGKLTEQSKKVLLQEFFTKEATQVPNTEGVLWLKEGPKKWVKHYFLLRPSGIYYTPKGKQKSRDVTCLASFEHNNVYKCTGYKNKFKSPTDHVFCLKHPKVQALKSKHVFVLCARDAQAKVQWMTFIRMAKYGYSMYEDYLITQEHESFLAAGRSLNRTPTRSASFKTAAVSLYPGVSSSSLTAQSSPSSSAASSPKTSRNNLKVNDNTNSKDVQAGDQITSSAPPVGGAPPPPPPPCPDIEPYGVERRRTRKKTRNVKNTEEGENTEETPSTSTEPTDDT